MGRDRGKVTGKRAVFLDRDGVLNYSIVENGRPYAPRRVEDFRVYDEAPSAVARMRAAGYATVLVTNQKDVGAGATSREALDAMHRVLTDAVPLDHIEICTCIDECPCYKPNPGMLTDAAALLGIDLSRSVMIGDRWRDVGAGKAAGCATIFIDRGYTEDLRDTPDHVVDGIAAAATIVEAMASPRTPDTMRKVSP
jgi:D-glycero-D-manno-heptose 1,7-bisphosphate phosphatase